MLKAAHVLAVDSKNLLDVVDNIRIKYSNYNPNETFSSNDSANEHPNTTEEETNVQKDVENLENFQDTIKLPSPVSCKVIEYPNYPKNIQQACSSSSVSSVVTTNNVGKS